MHRTRRDAIKLLGGRSSARWLPRDRHPTKFQLACMTLPYANFPSGARTLPAFAPRIRIRRVGYDAPKQSRT